MTISRALNRHGYFGRPAPKIRGLSAAELEERKAFVDEHWQRPASWWEENMNLVLDGVTLTIPPKPPTFRQRHMAQSIKHTCRMLQGETRGPAGGQGASVGGGSPGAATSRCASGRRARR